MKYVELERHDPSPVVRVHRAAAVAQAQGPAAGLTLLEALDDDRMARYQPYWAVRAELLARRGDPDAADAYRGALALTTNTRQRAALAARAHRRTGERFE